jgi:hypothetical protein
VPPEPRGLKLDVEKLFTPSASRHPGCGLMAAQFGAMVKRMHAGRSSQSGLCGALFADAGFTGTSMLESEYGDSAPRSRARPTVSSSTN